MRSVMVYLIGTTKEEIIRFLSNEFTYLRKRVLPEDYPEDVREEYMERLNKLPEDFRQRFISNVDQWNMEINGETYLNIELYNDFDLEFEPEELYSLINHFG